MSPIFFRNRVPFIPQVEGSECGAACLAMVLGHFGHFAPLSEVRQICGVSRDGLSAAKILNAARKYGLEAQGYSSEIESLHELDLPAIIHWEFKHFVILERITNKWAYITDPSSGRRIISLEAFAKSYTGVVLLFEEGSTFRKRKRIRLAKKRYFQALWNHMDTLWLIFFASIVLQIIGLTFPLAQKLLIDQAIVPKQETWLWGLGFSMLLAFVVQAILGWLRNWTIRTLQVSLDFQLVGGFLRHLLKLPLAFFLQRPNGDLIQRIDSNIKIQNLLSERTISSLLDMLLLVAYAGLMMVFNLTLGTLVVLLGMVRVIFQSAIRHKNLQLMQSELSAEGGASAILFETLSSLETIKAAGAEDIFVNHWASRKVSALNAAQERRKLVISLDTLLSVITSLGTTSVFLLAGVEVLAHRMTLGTFSAFLTLQSLFLTPLGSLLESYGLLQTVGGHLARIDDVMSTETEKCGARGASPISGDIRLEDVSFAYFGVSGNAINAINLHIRSGEKVAIVGPTGAGKSTIARLLLGMHFPTNGCILFDGINLRDYDLRKLRNRMGVVLQETWLRRGTIRDNLTLNNPNSSLEDLRLALQAACIEDEIATLPHGIDSIIEENGASLSGGQRQRLAIARALVHQPAILLLDEATSSLDLDTEAQVHANLTKFGCTQIIIAHRLATIRNADRILVLDKGSIVGQGPYPELLQDCGLFRQIVESAEAINA